MTQELQTSALHSREAELGAKFAEFGGWLMPLEYSGNGVLVEHNAVRNSVGVFDVSHLGKIMVSGPGALDFLNSILTNDLRKIGPGKAQYTLICNESGGVIDDLIAYYFSDEKIFLIPNAANCSRVYAIISKSAPTEINVTNLHSSYTILAIQGPNSAKLLTKLGLPTEMDYMGFQQGDGLTICRTGYTGEHGYELVIENEAAPKYFDEILEAGEEFGLKLCGLAARDTLRTEMGYSLHGNEISENINPLEAGIGWAVGWSKPVFLGSDELKRIKKAGSERKMVGLKALGRGIPRSHMEVVSLDDSKHLGEITSGTFSPTLRMGIGLALVDPTVQLGDRLGVVVRTRIEEFEVVKPPFVTPAVKA